MEVKYNNIVAGADDNKNRSLSEKDSEFSYEDTGVAVWIETEKGKITLYESGRVLLREIDDMDNYKSLIDQAVGIIDNLNREDIYIKSILFSVEGIRPIKPRKLLPEKDKEDKSVIHDETQTSIKFMFEDGRATYMYSLGGEIVVVGETKEEKVKERVEKVENHIDNLENSDDYSYIIYSLKTLFDKNANLEEVADNLKNLSSSNVEFLDEEQQEIRESALLEDQPLSELKEELEEMLEKTVYLKISSHDREKIENVRDNLYNVRGVDPESKIKYKIEDFYVYRE